MMNKKTININLDLRLEWARKIKGPLCDGHADNIKVWGVVSVQTIQTHHVRRSVYFSAQIHTSSIN